MDLSGFYFFWISSGFVEFFSGVEKRFLICSGIRN